MKKSILIFAVVILAFALGLAQTSTQHSATLSWGVSTTAGVNYNVYRANGTVTSGVCGAPGAFAALTTTPTASTSYIDTAVTAGACYVYHVTAVCTASCPAGVSGESAPGTDVAALIPVSPNAPSGLSVTLK